jgi:hypothetical protein
MGKAINSDGEVYLTKRLLVTLAKKAGRAASEETMKMQGYNVIAEAGWVVKVYADGTRERIKKIPAVVRPVKVVLK